MGTQTLLNYELTTEPFPLRASTTGSTPNGKFTIVASNPNPDETVTIKKITIRIPNAQHQRNPGIWYFLP